MKTDIQLSTRFLTAQNAHQVGVLVTVGGEMPVRRPPINVALVLDRSGSMSGEPLEAAKDAAIRFSQFLSERDQLSVVVFDDEVETIFGPAAGGSLEAAEAIRMVYEGGCTNLSGGWLKGREHVASRLVDGTNRVVLLTDGCANAGITDTGPLTALTRGAAGDRVSTTCIGFGEHFNEDLLQAMGDAGRGNYWYVEGHDQMTGIFEEEIEGLVALAAQNLEVRIKLVDPHVAGVTFHQRFPIKRTRSGEYRATLGDLYATSPAVLGALLHVDNVAQLGKAELAKLEVSADVVTEQGIEHRVTTMPVVANLDAQDHIEPEVERTFIRFEVARAREDAVKRADDGDYKGAARLMRSAVDKLAPYAHEPIAAADMEDLAAEAERLEEGEYESMDRKYHLAQAAACYDMQETYRGKIRRKRG